MLGLSAKPPVSDEDAMARFQMGDHLGFDILLERHGAPVLRFVRRMVDVDVSLAEDLMQDVFFRVIEHKEKFDPRQKFTTWLYTIAKNRCIDHIRVEGKKIVGTVDEQGLGTESGSIVLGGEMADGLSQETVSARRELKELVDKGVETLREEFKEVFLLREIEDMDLKEIAEVTGSPLGTVKSRLRYAYKALREYFEEAGLWEHI